MRRKQCEVTDHKEINRVLTSYKEQEYCCHAVWLQEIERIQ